MDRLKDSIFILALAKTCDDPSKWDRVLSSVEFELNNTVSRSTGKTPSKLLFGIPQGGKINDVIRLTLENTDVSLLEDIREETSKKIVSLQKYNEKMYNERRKKPIEYAVNDYVTITNEDTIIGVNKKLIPRYKGLYIVTKVLGNDRYVVTDIDGFQTTQVPYIGIISVDHMKPYC